MYRIVKTELLKLKRYHILWAGVLLMLFTVFLTLFTSTAEDGSVWTFSNLAEQVIKNNALTIFPMCITLIAGYTIAREEKDDTLKIILPIPISYRRLLCGKLIVCGLISVFFGVISTLFTVCAELVVGFPGFSVILSLQALIQITLNCLFLYIAVLPIIAIAAQIPNGNMIGAIIAFVYGYGGMFAAGNMTLANIYPITASLGLIDYRSYDAAVNWNMPVCIFSMLIMIVLTALIVLLIKDREPKKTVKKKKSPAQKKGW